MLMWRQEDGDIISRWLVQLVLVMVVVAFVGFEGVSIAVNHLSLDEDARQVAAATRTAYRDGRDIDDAAEAGLATAAEQGIEVTDVIPAEDDSELTFMLEKQASTLALHRFDRLEGITIARTARTVPLAP
ncbi:MAG: hypothetical protein EA388_12165 [Nitriliruptor sp.]|nr:MAG: hypothetical protein EA388_12165 [Nitriliruptor sp.]